MTEQEPAVNAVELRGITKSFSGTTVLHGVDFDVRAGEVHALLGGNGAGKSTLMKILEGVHTPDTGTIEVQGREIVPKEARSATDRGVAMIFQEFSLIPTLTVAQNIFLTREFRTSLGLLDDRACEKQAASILDDMGVDINPRALVSKLSTGEWQLTEIAKALSQDAKVLIMDEPTASLTSSESEALFNIIGQLKSRGIAIIYISHRMDEIFVVADRVTVLRDGRKVATRDTSDVDMEELIEMIIGKKAEQAFEWQERVVDRNVAPLLEVSELSAPPVVRSVSLKLFPGEILGIAGLMGSGRTEFARALFGIDPIAGGEVRLNGKPVRIRSAKNAVALGISLIPEDRREQGLVLDHTVRNNLVLPMLDRLVELGTMDDQRIDELSRALVERLNIKTDSIHQKVKLLSGGNQQKVVLAKWLAAEPGVLIMDEPTAGVDIGAKGEIVTMIRELADSGKGVIVISSEIPELLAVSDRIAVMYEGVIDQVFDRRDIDSEKDLQQYLHRERTAA